MIKTQGQLVQTTFTTRYGYAKVAASGPAGRAGYSEKPIRKEYKWKPWVAWHPVTTITGKRVWWQHIYRSRGWTYEGLHHYRDEYYYADDFDILSER